MIFTMRCCADISHVDYRARARRLRASRHAIAFMAASRHARCAPATRGAAPQRARDAAAVARAIMSGAIRGIRTPLRAARTTIFTHAMIVVASAR